MRVAAVVLGGVMAWGVAASAAAGLIEETLGLGSIVGAAESPDQLAITTAELESIDLAPRTDLVQYGTTGRLPFESDHAFDGFAGPFSNPVQFKDPRSLTEARGIFAAAWSDPNMPLGNTTAEVYALQLRVAVTERLQIFADKDGIVRLNPGVAESRTGLANIAVGAKYAFYRDPDTQTIASAVVQYEAPTGYANIFQNQGSGLLATYLVMGQEFAGNTHAIVQVGQNFAMNALDSGYFLTCVHLDKRFGRFTPFYEANWFYYNQDGTFLPTLSIEGGGYLNLGAGQVMGRSYVTNAVGFKYDLSKCQELGLGYEFQVSEPIMLFNNFAMAQYILRY